MAPYEDWIPRVGESALVFDPNFEFFVVLDVSAVRIAEDSSVMVDAIEHKGISITCKQVLLIGSRYRSPYWDGLPDSLYSAYGNTLHVRPKPPSARNEMLTEAGVNVVLRTRIGPRGNKKVVEIGISTDPGLGPFFVCMIYGRA